MTTALFWLPPAKSRRSIQHRHLIHQLVLGPLFRLCRLDDRIRGHGRTGQVPWILCQPGLDSPFPRSKLVPFIHVCVCILHYIYILSYIIYILPIMIPYIYIYLFYNDTYLIHVYFLLYIIFCFSPAMLCHTNPCLEFTSCGSVGSSTRSSPTAETPVLSARLVATFFNSNPNQMPGISIVQCPWMVSAQ